MTSPAVSESAEATKENAPREHDPGTRADPIMFFDSENGNGPYYHACGALKAVRVWLNRQITIGGVTAEGRAVVERLLDDVTEEQVADSGYNGILPPDWRKEDAALRAKAQATAGATEGSK